MEGTEKQDHRPSPVSLMQGEPLWFTSKSKGTEWLSSWLKIDEPQQNTSSHLKEISEKKIKADREFLDGSVVKNAVVNAGDTGSIAGP